MEDEQLRQQFSKASIERSKVFDKDTIMLQWKNLFENCNSEVTLHLSRRRSQLFKS
jgi:hypothetical protein